MIDKYFCGICSKLIRANSNSIFCDICKLWSHPTCNSLNSIDFTLLSNTDPNETWSCIKCNSEIFPFSDEHMPEENSDTDLNTNPFLLRDNSSDDDEEDEEQEIDCKYYDDISLNTALNQISESQLSPTLSLFHLNTCSLSKNLDEINILNSLNFDFDILGFSETRLNSHSVIPDIEGYRGFHNFSSTSAGGTSIYISNTMSPVTPRLY